MSQISTKPISGMRDFLPTEARRRRKAFAIIENVFQQYGFDPLDTPSMERLSTLLGKYGEEGDQLIFKVLKRGQKLERSISDNPDELSLADAGLRYDLTVPLARVYAQYPNEFPRIFKRYQIAPVWRADRPQKGRYREFFQCDVDIVGTSSIIAELEVISALSDILKQLSFQDFTIHINHREILFKTIQHAGVQDDHVIDTITILDKYDKIGTNGVSKELHEILPKETVNKLIEFLTSVEVQPSNNVLVLQHIANFLNENNPDNHSSISAINDLHNLLSLAKQTPALGHIAIDPFLARGLSYYTGPIFEIRCAKYPGSIGGGGRYDKLIGMFSGHDIPAVGFSLGIERILMILEESEKQTPQNLSPADVFVSIWDETLAGESVKIASELRQVGLRTDIYCAYERLGKQFGYADERNIPFAVIIAPEEAKREVVQIKNMKTGEQFEVKRSLLVETLSKLIST